MANSLTSSELAIKYREGGNPRVFAELLDSINGVIQHKVTSAMSTMPGRSDLRDELTSVAYEVLLDVIRTFNPDIAAFQTYLAWALDRQLPKACIQVAGPIKIPNQWVIQYRAGCRVRAQNPGINFEQTQQILREEALAKSLSKHSGDSQAAEDDLVKRGVFVAIAQIANTERLLNHKDIEGTPDVAADQPFVELDETLPVNQCKQVLHDPLLHPGFSAILETEASGKPILRRDLAGLAMTTIFKESA